MFLDSSLVFMISDSAIFADVEPLDIFDGAR